MSPLDDDDDGWSVGVTSSKFAKGIPFLLVDCLSGRYITRCQPMAAAVDDDCKFTFSRSPLGNGDDCTLWYRDQSRRCFIFIDYRFNVHFLHLDGKGVTKIEKKISILKVFQEVSEAFQRFSRGSSGAFRESHARSKSIPRDFRGVPWAFRSFQGVQCAFHGYFNGLNGFRNNPGT